MSVNVVEYFKAPINFHGAFKVGYLHKDSFLVEGTQEVENGKASANTQRNSQVNKS